MYASDPRSRPERVPLEATPEGDAIALGRAPVRVDLYIDFLCPFCRRFEQRSATALAALVVEGAAELDYHPLGFLDRLSTTRYSSRAASASGCAADVARFAAYKDVLFAAQPPEGGPGLNDEELIALGREAGIHDVEFAEGVREHRYLDWVAYVTARAIERGVQGTPTVFVAGVAVDAEPDAIVAAVAAVRV
jgi:protein-disulfide isomerase